MGIYYWTDASTEQKVWIYAFLGSLFLFGGLLMCWSAYDTLDKINRSKSFAESDGLVSAVKNDNGYYHTTYSYSVKGKSYSSDVIGFGTLNETKNLYPQNSKVIVHF